MTGRPLPGLLSCLSLFLLLDPSGVRAQDSDRGLPGLSKMQREASAIALAHDVDTLTALVAAETGAAPELAEELRSRGVDVRRADADVDYLRVRLPPERIAELASDARVAALHLPRSWDARPLGAEAAGSGPRTSGAMRQIPGPNGIAAHGPPGATTPASNPYLPTRDIGAPQFRARHPTFDGRGVTIAVLDLFPDFLLPELQWAAALDGTPVRKFADIRTMSDPRDGTDPTWVDMAAVVEARGGRFAHGGVTYRVPADGRYRFGLFDEWRIRGTLGGDVNRDGNPPGTSRLFGVLWDEAAGTVRVDTRQDHDFTHEAELMEYRVRGDLGVFGLDDPTTAVRESVGFAVQIDSLHGYVNLLLGADAHGTGANGIAAGASFFGGAAGAAAPAARLVPLLAIGGDMAYLVEALIHAARDPEIDLITSQVGTYGPGAGDLDEVVLIVAERLVALYGKPIITSAGNQGAMSALPSSPSVIGVGGYQHRDSWLANYGARVADEHNVLYASSYGPGARGAMKPDVLAPSGVLSLHPGFLEGGPQRAAYRLPSGYQVFAGTSAAAPMAASAVALLMSAAKQSGVPYDPDRIADALRAGARFLPDIPAYRQGAGLLQVESSWAALQAAAGGDPVTIEVSAPVRTARSHRLRTPHTGFGIHEREGWKAGGAGARVLVLTRRGGPEEPITFRARWLGDTASFSGLESVTLPRDVPVPYVVWVSTSVEGVHSALLWLDSPRHLLSVAEEIETGERVGGLHATPTDTGTGERAGGPAGEPDGRDGAPDRGPSDLPPPDGRLAPTGSHVLMNVVVASTSFEAQEDFTVERSLELPRPGHALVHLEAPEEGAVLRIDLETPGVDRAMVVYSPTDGFTWPFHTPDDRRWIGSFSPAEAGTWELLIRDGWRDALRVDTTVAGVLPPTPMRLSARLAGVDVEVSGRDPRSGSFVLRMGNRFAPVRARAVGGSLASVRAESRILRSGSAEAIEITVPVGSELFHVKLASDREDVDLDLYLFDCTGQGCRMVSYGAGTGASEEAWIDNPAPGRWRVVVDAPYGPPLIEYEYLDLFTHPRYGSAMIDDGWALRGSGEGWNAKGALRGVPAGALGPRGEAGAARRRGLVRDPPARGGMRDLAPPAGMAADPALRDEAAASPAPGRERALLVRIEEAFDAPRLIQFDPSGGSREVPPWIGSGLFFLDR